MKFLLIALLIIPLALPFHAIALTGDAARFDWSLGQPAVTADNTNTCDDTATARFDWSLGQPSIVRDSTATCAAAGGGGGSTTPIGTAKHSVSGGQTIIQGGQVIFQ